MTAIAEKTQVSLSSLDKTLSKRGNPEFSSISKLLHGMGAAFDGGTGYAVARGSVTGVERKCATGYF